MNRCLNDLFCYCSGEPKSSPREEEWNVSPHTRNNQTGKEIHTVPACKLSLKTCGNYKTDKEESC